MPRAAQNNSDALTTIFEERAENLSRSDLLQWTAYTTHDEESIAKLMGPGTKLLTGPRGSGKSTLLKTAYYRMLDSGSGLPIYVNYSKSLALEPLFRTNANALQLFRQWLIFKIIAASQEAMIDLGAAVPTEMAKLSTIGTAFIRNLEIGIAPDSMETMVAPSELLRHLESWTETLGRQRCVLLLDDAAHAFSFEQQQEFFEVFRSLRSRRVSAKAAVYPGITSYSPFFNVGHEAELVEAWYRPDDPDFLTAMKSIVERRIFPQFSSALHGKDDLVEYLAMTSFGLPRGFINMMSSLLGVDEQTSPRPTRQRAVQAVVDNAESLRGVLRALSSKIPRFKRFVELGAEMEGALTKSLKTFNGPRALEKKAVSVAIEEPLGATLERIMQFMEYAGIVRQGAHVSRGVKGTFQRYSLHYAVVASENGLALGRSFALSSVVEALRRRDAHAFVRTKGTALLGQDFESRCTLELPPCTNCSAPRVSEEQRFCMKCGTELSRVSIYNELLNAPIDRLPLTVKKLSGIREKTKLRTVQDILTDDQQTIRKVPYVGPVWAARIKNYAEEFVSV